ncbi:MAG: hypothetical protein RIS70_3080 [Planctomycetota bacterium]
MSNTGLFPDQSPVPLVPVIVPQKPATNEAPVVAVPPTKAPRVVRAALPPKPQNARYESLDMWRGVACLCLVLYHAAFFCESSMRIGDSSTWSIGESLLYAVKKTWCGVPIFFVISGYCIAASLDSLRRKPHSLLNFFSRRMHRIYPPLWIASLVAVAWLFVGQRLWNMAGASEHLPYLSELTAAQWFGNFTATERWLHHFTGGDVRYLMANTWTLCYEEQFYALAGLMLLLAPRRPLTLALVLSLVTLVGRHACRAMGVNIEGFFFDGHWLLFASGLLVYQAVNYFTRRQMVPVMAILACGAVYGWWERRSGPEWFDQHLGEYFLVSSLFALFLITSKRFDRAIARHWLSRPFNWCGKRSYSIYLTHFPLVVALAYGFHAWGLQDASSTVFVTVPSCVAVSLVSGWIFYNLVERHFQNAASAPAHADATAASTT